MEGNHTAKGLKCKFATKPPCDRLRNGASIALGSTRKTAHAHAAQASATPTVITAGNVRLNICGYFDRRGGEIKVEVNLTS
jgi:hypothetical protein